MSSDLTIAEVARRTGLTVHTLRYYEQAGLIAPVARAPGGQRRYAASDLEWIGFLLRLRETRMPIGQMQAFARLRAAGAATVGARRALLEQHLAQVQASLAAMQQAAQVLQTKIELYREHGAATSPGPQTVPGATTHA
jgi:DNA-binding transcriptional MerR regulator